MTGLQETDLGIEPEDLIIDIQADEHTCVIYEDFDDSFNHKLKCWGENDEGQLGQGDRVSVGGLNTMGANLSDIDTSNLLSSPLKLSLGNFSTCLVDESLYLYCWGKESNGNLGHPETPAGDVESVPDPETRVFK